MYVVVDPDVVRQQTVPHVLLQEGALQSSSSSALAWRAVASSATAAKARIDDPQNIFAAIDLLSIWVSSKRGWRGPTPRRICMCIRVAHTRPHTNTRRNRSTPFLTTCYRTARCSRCFRPPLPASPTRAGPTTRRRLSSKGRTPSLRRFSVAWYLRCIE